MELYVGMDVSLNRHVRFRAGFVCFAPNSRHSGRGWKCLKLTRNGHGDYADKPLIGRGAGPIGRTRWARVAVDGSRWLTFPLKNFGG